MHFSSSTSSLLQAFWLKNGFFFSISHSCLLRHMVLELVILFVCAWKVLGAIDIDSFPEPPWDTWDSLARVVSPICCPLSSVWPVASDYLLCHLALEAGRTCTLAEPTGLRKCLKAFLLVCGLLCFRRGLWWLQWWDEGGGGKTRKKLSFQRAKACPCQSTQCHVSFLLPPPKDHATSRSNFLAAN